MNNSSVTVTYTDKWQPVIANDRSSHLSNSNNVVLPEALKSIPKLSELPKIRHRWNINEEIASWLTSFHKHGEWLSTTLKIRPPTGSIFLYNRKKVKFRHDGFAWKKRREGRATREDHMKLKVRGEECISGGYVHSAIVPTFHRRSYWLLQNPDIVLVHYLNDWQPHESMGNSTEDSLVFNPALDSKRWEAKELLEQIQPMFVGLKLSVNGKTESTTGSASLEALVQYMLAEQAKSGHLIEQKNTKNDNKSSGSRASCACHKGKGKKRNSSRNSEKYNQEASTSGEGVQPTVTIEPQRPPPPQTKVVPSDILTRCLSDAVHSPGDGTLLQSQADLENSAMYSSSSSPRSGGGHVGHHPHTPPTPGLTDSDALASDTSPSITHVPPLVTQEECEQLKNLVKNDPNLKIASNRFGKPTVPETTVMLPQGIVNMLQLNAMTGQPPGQGAPGMQGQTVESMPVKLTFMPIGLNNLSAQTSQTINCELTTTSSVPSSCVISNSHQGLIISSGGGHESAPSQMDTTPVHVTTSSVIGQLSPSSRADASLPVPSRPVPSMEGHLHLDGTADTSVGMCVRDNLMKNNAFTGTSNSAGRPSGMVQPSARMTLANHQAHNTLTETSKSHPDHTGTVLNHQQQHVQAAHPQGSPQVDQSQVQSDLLLTNIKRIPQGDLPESNTSPSDMDLDPFEFLKHTLNLYDLDPETLSRSGIQEAELQGSDIMMDIQNSTNLIFGGDGKGKVNKEAVNGPVESVDERLAGRTDGSSGSLVAIADFSPEWSYPEGGIKVLVAGPWSTTSAEYSCVFDNFAVPASMIQPCVLRCFCPAHEKGLVPLHVMCNGSVISKSVLFEYKARRAAKTQQGSNKQSQQEWIELDDKQFQMALLERLEKIEQRLGHIAPQATQQGTTDLCNSLLSFEERVIQICKKLMQIVPPESALTTRDQIPRGMTLLHLAAALGYANLIKTLRKWRDLRECLIMELEMDPLNIDDHSCTPIMWACALGHKDAALRLYEWNPRCLRMSDRQHRLPISTARSRGHISLADCLQKMDHQNANQPATHPRHTNQPPTNSPHSNPIEIPASNNHLPSFMISSPASQTPDSSVGADLDFSPVAAGDNISVSSGILSQLSVSPHSHGGNSSQTSPHMSPLGHSDTSEGSIPTSLYDDLQALFGMGEGEMDSTYDESYMFKVPSQPPPPLNNNPPPPPLPSTSGRSSDKSKPSKSRRKIRSEGFSGISEAAWDELDKKRAENIALSLEKLKSMFAQDTGDDFMEEVPKPASKEQYLTLAEQILDALPARIKDDNADMNVDDIDMGVPPFSPLSVDIDEDIDEPGDYRSDDINSPASTYSTTDSSCMPSPPNMSREDEESLDWFDFFPHSFIDGTTLGGFSLLTLSDEEQRQLYKAALVIQNAFRQYKGRQQQKQQELEAAVIIQSYYRRYRDYVGYYQMSEAARVIQNRFRGYKNYRQFQRSRRAAIIIQSRFRSYRANKQFRKSRDAAILIQQRFRDKRMARLKREQDAARKIQRFIRHYQNRLKTFSQQQTEN